MSAVVRFPPLDVALKVAMQPVHHTLFAAVVPELAVPSADTILYRYPREALFPEPSATFDPSNNVKPLVGLDCAAL